MATKLQDLPLEQRLKLVEDLWDSIAAEEGAFRSPKLNVTFWTND
jgi:putative addiction module component (TIGR02574 family)